MSDVANANVVTPDLKERKVASKGIIRQPVA